MIKILFESRNSCEFVARRGCRTETRVEFAFSGVGGGWPGRRVPIVFVWADGGFTLSSSATVEASACSGASAPPSPAASSHPSASGTKTSARMSARVCSPAAPRDCCATERKESLSAGLIRSCWSCESPGYPGHVGAPSLWTAQNSNCGKPTEPRSLD